MTLNHERLRLVRDRIAHLGPEHFDMQLWVSNDGSNHNVDQVRLYDIKACGTMACFAGHIAFTRLLLLGEETASQYDAASWVGLPNDRLFYVDMWPEWGRELFDGNADLGDWGEPEVQWKVLLEILDALLSGESYDDVMSNG